MRVYYPLSDPFRFFVEAESALKVGTKIVGTSAPATLGVLFGNLGTPKDKLFYNHHNMDEIVLRTKYARAEEEILKLSVEGVKLAKSFVEDVEFSPEDASRTELPFLSQVVEATIAAGATTVNIPDTVGYSTPDHFEKIIRQDKQ